MECILRQKRLSYIILRLNVWSLCRSCFKQISCLKSLLRNSGKLSVTWAFDDSKESLFFLLGVVIAVTVDESAHYLYEFIQNDVGVIWYGILGLKISTSKQKKLRWSRNSKTLIIWNWSLACEDKHISILYKCLKTLLIRFGIYCLIIQWKEDMKIRLYQF